MICELAQFNSFITSLKPLKSAVLHFKPKCIDIHMVDSSGSVFTCVQYLLECNTEEDVAIDLDTLFSIKNNEVKFALNGNILEVKVGKVTHKCKMLADPSVKSRDRDAPDPSKWEHGTLTLCNEDMKALIDIISNKDKYDWIIKDGVFGIYECDQKVEMNVECDCDGSFKSRFGGSLLEDVLFAPKYFEKCTIYLGNNTPLILDYECTWLKCRYIVAPMIEED